VVRTACLLGFVVEILGVHLRRPILPHQSHHHQDYQETRNFGDPHNNSCNNTLSALTVQRTGKRGPISPTFPFTQLKRKITTTPLKSLQQETNRDRKPRKSGFLRTAEMRNESLRTSDFDSLGLVGLGKAND